MRIPRAGFVRKLVGCSVRARFLTRISAPAFSTTSVAATSISDRAAHGGTMHGGHVDRWTERATSNMGVSHSGACLRAYPAPARRRAVHASSPRKLAIPRQRGVTPTARDPGSDADPLPFRAQAKAATPGASCAPDARAKGAARCWCTPRYAHGEDGAFAARSRHVYTKRRRCRFSSPARTKRDMTDFFSHVDRIARLRRVSPYVVHD